MVNVKLHSFVFSILLVEVVLFQLFIRVLKLLKFSDDFAWYDEEFSTFGPMYLKLCVPNLT